VAFFSDSFHEVNGLALTSREFQNFAARRQLPFFSVHAGSSTTDTSEGQVRVQELQRSAAAFNLESSSDLSFDVLLWRHRRRLLDALRSFRPEVLHITGPGDIGMLGAWIAHEMQVPLVASWHTNLHEYAGHRLRKLLAFLPPRSVRAVSAAAERGAWRGTLGFYTLARMLFAPNPELVDLLRQRTGKPCFLMQRGVDAGHYSPSKRVAGSRPFTIGYVGRLSVEKNVRLLASVEQALIGAGRSDYRFVVIGPGNEAGWLRENMRRIELPGVLEGEALARAYANMDVFAFPSRTDTFGNVILEALASGVPAVVTTGGGPKFLVKSGETGFVAADDDVFARCILRLMRDRDLQRRMSAAARDFACLNAWDTVFEKVCDAYNTTLFVNPQALRVAS
jgi:glycosyltransferase involved in cell wall biosynthesis